MKSPARLENFLEQAANSNPSGIAVEDPQHGNIDYATLLKLSSHLADRLERRGIETGDRVGLLLSKSLASVTALYSCLQAGAAYVPVDASGPPDRAAFIFRDCHVRALFIETTKVEAFLQAWSENCPILRESLDLFISYKLDITLLIFDPQDCHENSESPLAYILYTSGSTGTPKGVIHTHNSALAFITWCQDEFDLSSSDRFSSHAPFHFDLSIFDIFVAAANAASLVLIDESTGKQPQRLAELIEIQRISIWYSTPSILRMLVEFGDIAERQNSHLRLVLFAGETYPLKQFLQLRSCWTQPRYYNLYGPTETNVCTFYKLPKMLQPGDFEYFPIGVFCSGDQGLIIDTENSEVEEGKEGELLVAGDSVMTGYWNLPERNRDAFVELHGQRWYRTGDIVRRLADGNLHYLSRRDRMIKRRGYRVELGEIESALYRFPGLVEAAAIANTDADGNVKVQAYIVPQAHQKPGVIALKTFCSKELPAYMIPDQFVVLDTLPKTSTDKIDYQRLQET